ncbi:DUF2341 domain-containing protein [Oleiharenicola lentus]|uniref:DUF2341 domain-containing protein n=1 Tax=Oleiharenicola lentus TaxID=2508720 RepID=UPI003F6717EC
MHHTPSRFGKILTLRATLAWLVFAATALAAHASWWNKEWQVRKPITLDASSAGANIADAVGTVPLLVRLHDGNFNFAGAQPDGSDLRFVTEDDTTVLPHHIEKYDGVLNEALVWVKIPDVKPGAKVSLWLYSGHAAAATTPAETKSSYDDATVLVYHFGERGQPPYDASGQGNNAQTSGLLVEGSLIGSGLRLDGQTTVSIPSSASLFWAEGGSVTWSAWVKFGAPQPRAVFFSRRENSKYFLIGADNGSPFVEVTYQSAVTRSTAGAPVAANTWHHLAIVASGERITVFLDGAVYGTAAAALPAMTGPAFLGGDGANGLMNSGGGKFAGEIDELRITRDARPAGALRFATLAEGPDSAAQLVTLGADAQPSSWMAAFMTGYMGVIIGSLTFDGWVVIVILFIMSIVSCVVMYQKAVYLNRVGRGNSQFLTEWRHVARDLSVLDSENAEQAKTMGGRFNAGNQRAMRNSSLYRIYHIGAEEIQHRLGSGKNAENKVLSGQSIQAIRASLDGGLVHEMHRLNSHMVLLTIAISGGPFLGLLGTVVGVMITFAAVAAAGEVNVNAIAPGIAAALAATVAGLAVAIPALFGYNYLLTRIKAASNDMHIFIDEFVTKLAEFYSGPNS